MPNGDNTGRVVVISPDGTLGSVPKEQQDDAVSSGYHLRTDMLKVQSYTGQSGYIPKSQWKDAQSAGYMLHPEEKAERELSGVLEKAWQEQEARREKLEYREQEALKSPTPLTSAASAIYPAMSLPEAIGSGSARELMGTAYRGLKGAAKGAAYGGTAGGALGYAIGGAGGAKTGAQIGATLGGVGGGIEGATSKAPSVEKEASDLVEKQLAVRAARVRAGIDPPSEDTIAEVLRKEFLSPPKKSGVPQELSSPKAKTPTYVPQGVPGAPAPEPPPMSKLSEGPTGLQHQVARQQALEDIRNATINRPGWTAKLPARMPFKKLSPIQQRTLIMHAIANDPAASEAIRAGARIGSAGDLASWTQEQLWARYMKEYTSPKPNAAFKQAIANEIARRGQIATAPNQVRP